MGLFDSLLGGGLGPGLWVTIGLNKQGFDEGMAKVKTDLTQWRNETNAGLGDVAKWGTAFTGMVAPILAVGAAAYSTAEKFGGMAQQLKDLSYTTGLTTEKLQQLQWGTILSGTNFDKVSFAIATMNIKMAEAADTTSAAGKAFAELGINPAGQTPDQVFDEVSISLLNVKDSAERAQIANELFGRSWREMLPFIDEYIKNKDIIRNKTTFSDEDLRSMAKAKSEWDDLAQSVTIGAGKIFVAFREAGGGWDIPDFDKNLGDLTNSLTAVGYTAKEIPPVFADAGAGAEDLGTKAEEARRKIEDLNQSLIDGLLSLQGTGMEQRDLGTKFNTLTEEKRINELKIETQPGSSEAADLRKRNAEIEKELEKIGLQMNQNNQSLNRGLVDIQRNQMDLAGTAIETDTKILDSLSARVDTTKTQYAALDQLGLDRWTTESALAQVSYQSIVDYAAEAVNFAGSHPVIQKIVQLSASGYDIDPSAMPAITAPVLKVADFSKFTLTTPPIPAAAPAANPPVPPAGKQAESTTGKSGSSSVVNLYQTNYGVPDNGVATNKALGRLAQSRGASGL
jgi:hypothetical protein